AVLLRQLFVLGLEFVAHINSRLTKRFAKTVNQSSPHGLIEAFIKPHRPGFAMRGLDQCCIVGVAYDLDGARILAHLRLQPPRIDGISVAHLLSPARRFDLLVVAHRHHQLTDWICCTRPLDLMPQQTCTMVLRLISPACHSEIVPGAGGGNGDAPSCCRTPAVETLNSGIGENADANASNSIATMEFLAIALELKIS